MPIGASVAPDDRYMQWAGIWRKQVSLGKKWSIAGEKKLNHETIQPNHTVHHQTARQENQTLQLMAHELNKFVSEGFDELKPIKYLSKNR